MYIYQCSLQIFHKMVQQDRVENQGEMRHFMGGPMININVRRNYLYEDAFEKLSVQNGTFTMLIFASGTRFMQRQQCNFNGLYLLF